MIATGKDVADKKAPKTAYDGADLAIRNASIDYSINGSLEGRTVYKRGRLITKHEGNLPVGLLGYTDTNAEIWLTLRDDFDVPKRKVDKHEELHCEMPDLSELEIRYKTELEFRPADSSQARFSIYQEPLYKKG
ncbi:MAG: hypothetical protein QXD77_01440 [Candidatus Aenigmatarchaeota archaeon]